jgi:hypothetical protein
MMPINFELVYKARAAQEAIHMTRRKAEKAKQEVVDVEKAFLDRCSKISGVPTSELQVGPDCCIAEGISLHVYHMKVRGRWGSPENKCIFCGCDNVDTI